MASPKYKLVGVGSSGRPLPYKLGMLMEELLKEIGISYINSGLRTQAAVTWARGQGAVLSSQAELYQGYITGQPGYNPANPPGYSTHERRSDGVAFPQWTRGLPIPWWACGIDIDPGYIPSLISAARKRGWIVSITYPGNPSEGHHVNFRREPKFSIFKPLKRGSRGRRVKKLTRRLKYLGRWEGKPVKGYGPRVEKAVKEFQKKNHLVADGVVGPRTMRQININFRQKWQKNKRKRNK